MKLQKQLSKKRGNKIYHKYVLVIPNDIIEKSGFKSGDELLAEVKRGEVRLLKHRIHRIHKQNTKSTKKKKKNDEIPEGYVQIDKDTMMSKENGLKYVKGKDPVTVMREMGF